MTAHAQRQFSLEEYFGIEEMSAVRHEYLDGGIYALPGGSRNHNQIAQNLTRVRMLAISESAPVRRTNTVSGEPAMVIVRRKPWPMESRPTSTATTPAIPVIAAAAEPLRAGRSR